MPRQQIISFVPKEWEQRREEGKLCPVCAKDKLQFDKFKRVYCSDKCSKKFGSKWVTWNSLREKIIKRDGKICADCKKEGTESYEIEVDHITAIVNGGKMWDENNLQVLCKPCHNKKTKKDLAKRTKGNQKLLLKKKRKNETQI